MRGSYSPGKISATGFSPRSGVSSYVIGTVIEGRQATGIKALFYAPGCAIQTLDLPLSGSDNPTYTFICQPVKNISVAGTLVRFDRIYDVDLMLQAKYVVPWARKFLGLDAGIVTAIPVGETTNISEDGRFRMDVPDLSRDYPGEFQIWAKDKKSRSIVAKLIPKDNARIGHAPEIVLEPCLLGPPRHDAWGFAKRSPSSDVCDR